MTKLTDGKEVTRETGILYKGRPIIITIQEKGIIFRFKGLRVKHHLDYEVALECVLKVEAREAGVKI